LSAPASTISGTSISLGVTPLDASQAGVPCYIGTVHFTSSDPALALPADYTFTVSEGPHTFSLTPRTPGPQSVTVTDTVTGTILSTIVINVSASPTQSTITANPSTNLAANGSAASTITVQYKDVNGVNLTSGGGTVTLSTTHGTLTTPVNHNDGTWTASLTATQLGTATISGTIDGVAMTSTATVQFVAGAPAAFILSAPANASTGVPFSVTVTAKDANDNTIDGYNGTVFFVSNDSASPTLPADYTFVAGDHGVHTFTNGVVFHSVGNLSLFVGDRAAPGITGNAIIAVKGATTTVVTSNVTPARPGGNVTWTATVSTDAAGPAMTGDVTFMDGATTLTTTPAPGPRRSPRRSSAPRRSAERSMALR